MKDTGKSDCCACKDVDSIQPGKNGV
jgi:hypothetical protein